MRYRAAAAATNAAQEATLRLRAEVSEVEERKGDHIRALLAQHEQVRIPDLYWYWYP